MKIWRSIVKMVWKEETDDNAVCVQCIVKILNNSEGQC